MTWAVVVSYTMSVFAMTTDYLFDNQVISIIPTATLLALADILLIVTTAVCALDRIPVLLSHIFIILEDGVEVIKAIIS